VSRAEPMLNPPALRPRAMLVLATVAVGALPVVYSSLGSPGTSPVVGPAFPTLVGATLVGLQLRHSFAAARGERSLGGHWTLLLMIVLVYVPLLKLGGNWMSAQALVAASALMTLRGRLSRLIAAIPVVGTAIYVPIYDAVKYPTEMDARTVAFDSLYWLVGLTALTAVLYGVTWLVRTADALQATRTEFAELAVGRERLRVSRDLHDLLGQSLSAVSLKGDLALRLLSEDPRRAGEEIAGLTQVARDALHGVRAVTWGAHGIGLHTELDGAQRLLSAAGVQVDVRMTATGVDAHADEVFAWAVREGVTNVLRHSQATYCSIRLAREGRSMSLAIENDAAPARSDGGAGLRGLAERARAAGGEVSTTHTDDGRFRLVVTLPEEPA
jgi:two-component system, NarL family, sensor histidine kinase DesK